VHAFDERDRNIARFAQRQFGAWLSKPELAPSLDKIRNLVMPPVSTDALVDVANLMRVILAQKIPGDIVECGVWRGGTAFFIAGLLEQAGVRDRKVWLFDSFEGMPQVEPIDGAAAIAESNDPESFLSAAKSRAPIDEVRQAASDLGVAHRTELVKGWFSETLPAARDRIGPISLLHIDCDWYASVRCCLDNLYDQVADGGFVFLDDYYHYDGCAFAAHEFLASRRLPYRIESVEGKDWGGCEYYYAARFRKGGTNWKAEYLLDLAAQDIKAVIASEQSLLVVGEELRAKLGKTRRTIPFLEQNGQYWGKPPDAETAIRELERLRRSGAEFLAFPWTDFWWFDAYPEITSYLKPKYREVLANDRLVLYDLRPLAKARIA
jgi:O-methyltransferase